MTAWLLTVALVALGAAFYFGAIGFADVLHEEDEDWE
jgi:hypothetical protein